MAILEYPERILADVEIIEIKKHFESIYWTKKMVISELKNLQAIMKHATKYSDVYEYKTNLLIQFKNLYKLLEIISYFFKHTRLCIAMDSSKVRADPVIKPCRRPVL